MYGTSAFDAVEPVRGAVIYAEVTRIPLCTVSIDFSAAFDKISHSYLMSTIHAHGFSNWIQKRIMGLYDKAASEMQINGFRSSLIQIHSFIRQGRPLTMQLFAQCLHQLIQTMEEELKGIQNKRGQFKRAVIAFADDNIIFFKTSDYVRKLEEILLAYEDATGANVNMRKFRALALETWDTATKIMDIPYHTHVKIVGFQFTNTVNTSAKNTWSMVTTKVRALAQETYYRNLNLNKHIHFVHQYLLAKIWYVP
jgi:hypothetical protein